MIIPFAICEKKELKKETIIFVIIMIMMIIMLIFTFTYSAHFELPSSHPFNKKSMIGYYRYQQKNETKPDDHINFASEHR